MAQESVSFVGTKSSDGWNECTIRIGVNDQLRRAKLLSECEDLHHTAPVWFWVIDSMEGSWETLKAVNDGLRTKKAQMQAAKKNKKF